MCMTHKWFTQVYINKGVYIDVPIWSMQWTCNVRYQCYKKLHFNLLLMKLVVSPYSQIYTANFNFVKIYLDVEKMRYHALHLRSFDHMLEEQTKNVVQKYFSVEWFGNDNSGIFLSLIIFVMIMAWEFIQCHRVAWVMRCL